MFLQSGDSSGTIWLVVGIIVATILLWLALWLSSKWVISKEFAKNKKWTLLITALILVLIIPLIASLASLVLSVIGNGVVWVRQAINNITPWNEMNPSNQLMQLVAILEFLVFVLILKFISGMEWKDTIWISLLGLFILYIIYTFFPELQAIYPW